MEDPVTYAGVLHVDLYLLPPNLGQVDRVLLRTRPRRRLRTRPLALAPGLVSAHRKSTSLNCSVDRSLWNRTYPPLGHLISMRTHLDEVVSFLLDRFPYATDEPLDIYAKTNAALERQNDWRAPALRARALQSVQMQSSALQDEQLLRSFDTKVEGTKL